MSISPADQYAMWASGAFAIVGVIIGALLTYYFQWRQWRADNRKAEYGELLTAINRGFTTIVALSAKPPFIHDDNYDRELLLAETSTAGTIAARIIIAREIGRLDVMKRWTTAARKYAHDKDFQAFNEEVNRLSEDIRKSWAS